MIEHSIMYKRHPSGRRSYHLWLTLSYLDVSFKMLRSTCIVRKKRRCDSCRLLEWSCCSLCPRYWCVFCSPHNTQTFYDKSRRIKLAAVEIPDSFLLDDSATLHHTEFTSLSHTFSSAQSICFSTKPFVLPFVFFIHARREKCIYGMLARQTFPGISVDELWRGCWFHFTSFIFITLWHHDWYVIYILWEI